MKDIIKQLTITRLEIRHRMEMRSEPKLAAPVHETRDDAGERSSV
jgi:hypothetical protein